MKYISTNLPDSSLEKIALLRAQYTFLTIVPKRIVNNSQKHFYMDDYIQSHATEEDACKAVLETKHCLQTVGFGLTKFVSNSPLVLNQVPPEDKDNQTDIVRVLGFKWNFEKDFF